MKRTSDRMIEHIIEHIRNGNYGLAIAMLKNIRAKDIRSIEEMNRKKLGGSHVQGNTE